MRKMKDSGIEWIGDIPEGWEVRKINHLFQQRNEKGSESNILLAVTQQYGVVPQSEIEGVVKVKEDTDLQLFKTIRKNDYVISLRSFQGGIEYSLYDGVCSPAYQVFFAKEMVYFLFFRYLFKSDCFISKINSLTVGIRDGKNIQYNDLKTIFIPYPPLPEQQRIADYLDAKCARIDESMELVRQSMEKLRTYKLSLITEAVTKGLDPDVPMKDSGIPWIGEIPAGWELQRIKNTCKIVDCKNRTPENIVDGNCFVIRTSCVKNGQFLLSGGYFTDEKNYYEWTKKGKPQKGDILFTREAPMGEACLFPDITNACLGQRMMFFRPCKNLDSKFLLYSIYGPLCRYFISSINKGSTVGHLKISQVENIPFFSPPLSEQQRIADYLDAKCARIDALLEEKERLLDRLAEYKKSLIFECVTGKREVSA